MNFFHQFAMREHRKSLFLVAWLLCIFLLGGGSRDDVTSLIVLRPAAVLVLAIGLYKLSAEEWTRFRWLFAFYAAMVLLIALHLVPLPPALWQSLPQRDLVVAIDREAGLSGIWRPLSIAPPRTWNALLALAVPASAMVLAARLSGKQLSATLVAVLIIGVMSLVLGILQISGGASVPYFYTIHSPNAANGLFANRNHQAALLACLFPLLAAFASGGESGGERSRVRGIIATTCALALVPALLVTGSRAGIALGLVGALASLFVYRPANMRAIEQGKAGRVSQLLANRTMLGVIFVGLAGILTTLAILFSRAEAFSRLFNTEGVPEVRAKALAPLSNLALDYLPLGSGAGTFVEAFHRVEPRSFLSPTYLNHAHIDYLEWIITGGVPAIVLIVAAAGGLASAIYRLFWLRPNHTLSHTMARAGAVVICLLAGSSIVDYPLRTPSLAALGAIAAVLTWRGAFGGEMRREKG